MSEPEIDAKGRYTHAAVERVAGMQIPIELLAELRMSAAAMSRAVKKITDIANLSASGAKAVLTHAFMREAAGEQPTIESAAHEAAAVFGPARKQTMASQASRASRGAAKADMRRRGAAMIGEGGAMIGEGGALIGLAGPPATYGAGFDFGSFLRNAGKAAKIATGVAAGVAPLASAAARQLGLQDVAAGIRDAGRAANIASHAISDPFGTAQQAAYHFGRGGAGGAGGLDVGGAAGSLISSDLQHASLRNSGRGGAGGAGGLILGGAGGAGGLILGGQKKTYRMMRRSEM